MEKKDKELSKVGCMSMFAIIVLVISMSVYSACSVSFVKGDGQGHRVYQRDRADVDDVEIDIALRKRLEAHGKQLDIHSTTLQDSVVMLSPSIKDSMQVKMNIPTANEN